MGNTSKNGLIDQTAVLNRLVQLGYEVLLPWSQALGYDLAYYAWLSNDGGFLKFNTSTVSIGGAGVWKKKRSGYRERADWFGVYSPDTGKVYMISVWDAPDASQMILRLKPTKNYQELGVWWAKDYEF